MWEVKAEVCTCVYIMVAKLLEAFPEPLYSNQGTAFSFHILSSLLHHVPNDAFTELNQETSGDSNGNLESECKVTSSVCWSV